jgi:hypothetical protein
VIDIKDILRAPMLASLLVAGLLLTLLGDSMAIGQVSGRIGQETIYFTKVERVRSHRYDFQLKLPYNLTDTATLNFDGRARYDLALMDHKLAPQRNLSSKVRDNEILDLQLRKLYLDWLTNAFVLKLGRQLVDWIDALVPNVANFTNALDLRQGGFGTIEEVLVPVDALLINHQFFKFGSVDWLLVFNNPRHILPKQKNGYGYYETLEKSFGTSNITFVDDSETYQHSEFEYGARFLATVKSVDVTLMSYAGHQRMPIYEALPSLPTNPLELRLRKLYPRTQVYGLSTAYSKEALVTRLMVYYEPRRDAEFTRFDQTTGAQYRDYIQATRYGLGLDYVFSRHLKAYTESWLLSDNTYGKNYPTDSYHVKNRKLSQVYTLRLTNETLSDAIFSVDTTYTVPEISWAISPSIEWNMTASWKTTIGARFIKSLHTQSRFEVLKESSHAYGKIDFYF